MFEMLEEACVRIRLSAMALEPVMEGDTIARVSCCDRNGAFTITPKMVIDCSGDGDISAKAGVPYALCDASGNTIAVTISFHIVGVDCGAAFAYPDPYF